MRTPSTPLLPTPLLLILLVIAGCQPQSVQTAKQPELSQGTFHNDELGVGLEVPKGWRTRPSEEYVLLVSPEGKTDPSISLDVPDLPAHVPGWIPLNLVKEGYLDDLKKQWPGAKVQEDTSARVPGAKARRVHVLSGDGKKQEFAVLMVRDDRVYILRGTGPGDEEALGKTFDEVLSSLRWGKGDSSADPSDE